MDDDQIELTTRQKAEWIFRRMAGACKDAAPKDVLATAVSEIEKALEPVIHGDDSYFEGFKRIFD
jgi:hypothetical protein